MTRRSRLVFAAAALFAAAVPSFPLALAAAPQGCVLLEDLLQAAPGQAYAGLGRSLAVHGSTAVAGATHLDVVGSDSGGAYVFVAGPPGGWSQEAELLAPQPAQQDYFGISVAVHGDTIAVGSLTDGGPGYQSGAVLLFERTGGTWSFVQQLVGSGVQAGDWFGESVALVGDRLAVGCTRENHANGYGLTYVFRRAGSAWVEEARLVPDLFPAAYAGQAVALQGDRLVVGNPLANSVTHTGFAYVYERDGAGAWNRVAVLAASDGRPGDGFGRSVALDGDNVLVGARQANPG